MTLELQDLLPGVAKSSAFQQRYGLRLCFDVEYNSFLVFQWKYRTKVNFLVGWRP